MADELRRRKNVQAKRPGRRPTPSAGTPRGDLGLIQSLMDTSHERAVLLDPDGTILALNKSAAEAFGLDTRAAVGRCLFDMLPPELARTRKAAIERALRHGTFAEIEDRRDGCWLRARAYPVRNARGITLGVAVFAEDVTGQRLAAAEQEATVELLRLLNTTGTARELVRIVLGFFRQRSGCEAVRMRLHDGDDLPYYEIKGLAEDIVRTENSLCVGDEIGNLCRDGCGHVLECLCANVLQARFDPSKPFFTDFGSFWTNSTTDLLANADGVDWPERTPNRCNTAGFESVAFIPLRSGARILGLLQLYGKARDTFIPKQIAHYERLAGYVAGSLARLLAEEALRENQRRFRAILDSLKGATIDVFDRDGKWLFTSGSPELQTQLQTNSSALVGANVSDVLPPETARPLLDAIRRVFDGGSPERHRLPLPLPHGVFWRDVSLYPTRTTGGDVAAVLGFTQDATQEKQREDKLLVYQKQLRQMVAELSQAEETERRRIAGDLHDDVGQALAVAKMKADLASRSSCCPDCIAIIREIAGMIDDAARGVSAALFDLSPPELHELGLTAALNRFVTQMRERFPGMRFTVEGNLRPKTLARTNRAILFRATRELLLNATKHAQACNVRVSVCEAGNETRIQVEDDGIGLDTNAIFQNTESGSGFGLLNIRERLDHLGGRLEIESQAGRGTVVRLIAPLKGE